MRERILRLVERLLPLGVGTAVRNLLEELWILGVHLPQTLKAKYHYRRASDLSIQMGCGLRMKPGWINIDLVEGSDFRLDLRRRFPFSTGSSTLIYAEHFLEHLDYPDRAGFLLLECYRVLQSGGILSLVVPDIDLVLHSYVQGGTAEYYEAQKRWHPSWYQTQIEHINYNFRQDGEHRFAYDYETLSRLLEKNGFVDVRRRQFDPALDSPDRLVGSLYVDAKRP
jgi:predicted SAM-dependent methyltransferase